MSQLVWPVLPAGQDRALRLRPEPPSGVSAARLRSLGLRRLCLTGARSAKASAGRGRAPFTRTNAGSSPRTNCRLSRHTQSDLSPTKRDACRFSESDVRLNVTEPTIDESATLSRPQKTDGPRAPSDSTIKRLFALSSNKCAFPQCTTALIHGDVVVGEICHIKAAKPGGPRYDENQSNIERHGFENLILMCGTHHTVIDSDEEAYTIERLTKLKSKHENGAVPIDETSVDNATHRLLQQTACPPIKAVV